MSGSKLRDRRGLAILSLGKFVADLSSLLILKECMTRLQSRLGLDRRPEVYEYFDIVGGVGTGGISAAMLGRLRMPLDEAISNSMRLTKEVFSEEESRSGSFAIGGSSAYKSSKMQRTLKTIIQEVTGDENEMMLDRGSDGDRCKTVVFAMPANNRGMPRVFRSYEASADRTPKCTIWEVLSATTANPALFKSFDIVDDGSIVPFVGGSGCSNPLVHILFEADDMYRGRWIECVVSIGAGQFRTTSTPLPILVNPFQHLFQKKVIEAMKAMATFSDREAQRMAARFEATPLVYFRLHLDQEMQRMELGNLDRPDEVLAYVGAYIQLAEVNSRLDKIVGILAGKAVASVLIDKPPPFKIGEVGNTGISLPRSTSPFGGRKELVPRQSPDTSKRLELLSPETTAIYLAVPTNTAPNACTEGTRTLVLSDMIAWSGDPASAKIYWLNGMAGTGKTTIARSLARMLTDRKQLGANFFCTPARKECQDVTRIIPTIAYQLAQYSLPFQRALCEVLENNPDATLPSISMQFEQLLVYPLLQVQATMSDNVVIVIDALDECDEKVSVHTLLDALFHHAPTLPIKFFLASRPHLRILRTMLPRGEADRSVLHLHEVERSLVQADIRLYLQEELEFMSLTSAELDKLVQLADNLFIYAATTARYIQAAKNPSDSRERLRIVLDTCFNSNRVSHPSGVHTELDQYYRIILEQAFLENGLGNAEDQARLVLWTAACVREPVTIETIAALTGLGVDYTRIVLGSLRSVLNITEASHLVATLHASFCDFIFAQERSQHFFRDRERHAAFLARQCFEIMQSELRFNICQLESSFVPDGLIADLNERVNKYISRPLSYACQYWADHLSLAAPTDDLCTMLDGFLSNRLLFWMEVLNLSKPRPLGGIVLQKIRLWLAQLADDAPSDIIRLASDAHHFVALFSSNPISLCTPHIYVSALPLCPKSSLVFVRYSKHMKALIEAKGTAVERRRPATLASWDVGRKVESTALSPDGSLIGIGDSDGNINIIGQHLGTFVARPFQGHTARIKSLAFSPDGTYIASGSSDKTIRVWSVQGCNQVAGPFEGHTDSVNSVAFSFDPDCALVLSGSSDCTICLWRFEEGKPVLSPFTGHCRSVNSVAFSPDSTLIASGSDDCTIRVWRSQDGRLLTSPLEGHRNRINSVAFSPDSTNIVSGSCDKTICVWGAKSGQLVAGPFNGHTNWVNSVAFSPQGTLIVSGSYDCTICVWSVHDGELIAGPFKGHSRSVNSVAFSPDSTRIVSGSSDNTVCVWDIEESNLVVYPSEGHNRSINSVSISRDSTRIASGSGDRTICVWSTENGELIAGPFNGHTDQVTSVAFSPDSLHIASGSSDKTICVWNAQSTQLVVGPLKGHTRRVNSVAFSPDGTRIVSGSDDHTSCVWGGQDGKLIAGPFKGHTDSVRSVAFSPDGTLIVSGSDDCTICVRSMADSRLVAGPFEGHSDSVNSVAFSPDGTLVVSGSDDHTIRVWSVPNDRPIADPFEGHAGPVMSVAFSPDGTHIASGSCDGSICVWSTQDGKLINGPLEGHTDSVNSVVFSPDCERVVSGSDDCTIRVWSPFKQSADRIELLGILPDIKNTVPSVSDPSVPSTSPQGTTVSVRAHGRKWYLQGSGWIVDHDDRYLFWVPPHLRSCFPTLYQSLVIGLEGSLQVSYGSLLGGTWSQCYTSNLGVSVPAMPPALAPLGVQCALSIAQVADELAPIPYIGPLVECLTVVFQAVERSKVNKDQWKLLQGRCVMVTRIAGAMVSNHGEEDDPGMKAAASQLEKTLNNIGQKARQYNEMDETFASLQFQSISEEIQGLFNELDECLGLFSFAADVAQSQWVNEFKAVQKQELAVLRDAYNNYSLWENTNIDITAISHNQDYNQKPSGVGPQNQTTPVANFDDAKQVAPTILGVTDLQLPPSLLLGKQCVPDGSVPISTGTTCDIYSASFLDGEKVAIKAFRIRMSDQEIAEWDVKRFVRIAKLWSDFKSHYTLPFYGIGMDPESFEGGEHLKLYMISPLMKNFDAITYLKQYRNTTGVNKRILRIITDAALGLQYLHNRDPPVVHLGMKGDNILITDSGGGILGGFGSTKALEIEGTEGEEILPDPDVMTEEMGYSRWTPPELFLEDTSALKTSCDVWGWAMAALEIVSGSVPYHLHTGAKASSFMFEVLQGPPRRKDHIEFEDYAYRPDEMWELLERCWKHNPEERPRIGEVVVRLKDISEMEEYVKE